MAETHLVDESMAPAFIEQVGIATLYPTSSEIPNLFSAYVGDPEIKPDSGWSTPSGTIYTWRWTLGRQVVAFYTSLIRRRPTWVSWPLLPVVLRLWGAVQPVGELYEDGKLSRDAHRIAQVLDEAEHPLSTGEIRRAANFPIGKPQRAAYLKAIAELEDLLLLEKVFSPDDNEMRHALVCTRYPHIVTDAKKMIREVALEQLLLTYLLHAVYIKPSLLAKHLRLPTEEVLTTLNRLEKANRVTLLVEAEKSSAIYIRK
jgi:hypothetical protein